jgi:erythromycin esterase-like protein
MMWTDSPRQMLEFVLEYLESRNTDIAKAYRERILPLLGDDARWETQSAAMDPTKSFGRSPQAVALRIATDELVTELSMRRPEFVANHAEDAYGEAMRYATGARQLLAYHGAIAAADKASGKRLMDCLGMRDVMMADNLAYIVERERPRGRVLAFAHNRHLKFGCAEWQLGADLLTWWPAGSHLSHLLGKCYAVIGLGVGTSASQSIGPPEPETVEARLLFWEGQGTLIATHGGRNLPAAVVAKVPTRITKCPGYFPFTAQSLTDFDYLAVLHTIA